MANKTPAKPFTKGDPRINRKGRPKNFDGLRALAQLIANEKITSKDGQTAMSRAELILRSWANSGNWQLQRQFIETAYGKIPDVVEGTGEDGVIKILVEYANRKDNTS